MPTYMYKCKAEGCGWADEYVCPSNLKDRLDDDVKTHHFIDTGCFGPIIPVYQISHPKPMQEHFNPSVGKHISSMQEFREELKVASDEATARTGIVHNFEPIDHREREALGVTEQGLDETERRRRAKGETEGKVYMQVPKPKAVLPLRPN